MVFMTLNWHGRNYLSGRSRCVCYNGQLLTFRNVWMGIPCQGSILGPLVFDVLLLFYNHYFTDHINNIKEHDK